MATQRKDGPAKKVSKRKSKGVPNIVVAGEVMDTSDWTTIVVSSSTSEIPETRPLPKSATMPALLGIQLIEPVNMVAEISKGLRYEAVEKLANALGLSLVGFAKSCLGISAATLTRRKQLGKLNELESDRAARFARLVELATSLHQGDANATRRWLNTPLPALEGQSPVEYSRSEVGFREVENLIIAMEHGMFY